MRFGPYRSTVAHSFLEITLAVSIESSHPCGQNSNYGCGSRPLPELTGRFIVRADDDHTTPLSVSGKPIRLSIILLSPLVSCLALNPIKPQHPPLVVRSRQFH